MADSVKRPPLPSVRSWIESLERAALSPALRGHYRRAFERFTEWLMEREGIEVDPAHPEQLRWSKGSSQAAVAHLERLITDPDGLYIREYVFSRTEGEDALDPKTLSTVCSILRVALDVLKTAGLSTFDPERLLTPSSAPRPEISERWLRSLASTRGKVNSDRARVRKFYSFLLEKLGLTFNDVKELRAALELQKWMRAGITDVAQRSSISGTLTAAVCCEPKELIDEFAGTLAEKDARSVLSAMRTMYRWLKENHFTVFDADSIVNPHNKELSKKRLRDGTGSAPRVARDLAPKKRGRGKALTETAPPTEPPVVKPKPVRKPRATSKAPKGPAKPRASAAKAATPPVAPPQSPRAVIVPPGRIRRVPLTLGNWLEIRTSRDALITGLILDRALKISLHKLSHMRVSDIIEGTSGVLDTLVFHEATERRIVLPQPHLQRLSRYLALATEEELLSRTWIEQGDDAPLLLSLDGGSLIPDDSTDRVQVRPEFEGLRSEIVSQLIREERITFAIISRILRKEIADDFSMLNLRRWGLGRLELSLQTQAFMRKFAVVWEDTPLGRGWKWPQNNAPLLPAADGGFLTADDEK